MERAFAKRQLETTGDAGTAKADWSALDKLKIEKR